jgi:hypothetical protein
MLKTLEKSNISKRVFQANKSWTISSEDYPVISGSFTTDKDFDKTTATQQEGLYTYPLFKSTKSKYYSDIGNPFTLHGTMENVGDNFERIIGTTGYIIAVPQNVFGEKIQPESLRIEDLTNDVGFADDGFGNLTSTKPEYTLKSIDLEAGTMILSDTDDGDFTGTLWSAAGQPAIDLETGLAKVTFGGDTDTFYIARIDIAGGRIQTELALNFASADINQLRFGNIMYSEGLIIFNDIISQFSKYTMNFKSTKTINEMEVLVTSKAGEFNYSQNPSAIDVKLSGSYETEITGELNYFPSGSKTIKVIDDITQTKFYSGSVNQSISGSWDDYHTSASIDPTGSYLAPFITTIGLYDKSGQMIAIAKLPKPIKNLPDHDMNFVIRIDT